MEDKRLDRLNEISDNKINPKLSSHLGGMKVTLIEDDIAYVKFSGSCRSCYYAEDTLENIVRVELLKADKDLKDVKIDRSVDDDILDFARNLLKKDK
jgi:Fe-S cluster biogenesis protein NfuA